MFCGLNNNINMQPLKYYNYGKSGTFYGNRCRCLSTTACFLRDTKKKRTTNGLTVFDVCFQRCSETYVAFVFYGNVTKSTSRLFCLN